MKKRSYWLRAGLFSFGERFSILLFGFGSLFFLIRMISKEAFGIWVLFLAIKSILEISRKGLVQNALVKFLSTHPKKVHGKINTASLILNGLLTISGILLILMIAKPMSTLWNAPELEMLLHIYIFTYCALIPLFQFDPIQQANLDFKGVFWANFTKQGLFFLFILFHFCFVGTVSLKALAYWQVLTASAGSLISGIFAWKYLNFSLPIDWIWIKRLFHFGKFVFGTNLSTMLYKTIDKMMLGALLNPVAVAIYELAIRITNFSEVPTFSAAAVVFPQSARKAKTKEKEGIKFLYEKSVGAIFVLLLPCIIFILLFPEWIIWLVAGSKYLEAAPILQLTMLYGLFVPFAIQFGTILDSIGKPKINFYFTLGGAVLNICFNYLLISLFGLIGAVYGTLSTYFISFGLMQFFLYQSFKIKAYKALQYTFQFYQDAYMFGQAYLKKHLYSEVA